ncbi:flagellar basal body rod protein FlgB [Phenylobacterium sp.]|uniref:flagellar basal body rod protein FlgB n=1 Tax=Phenylobacterium sp. TaxID=1871053 RepID=UPI00272867B9|nr:flagellar basal body rod protein FlgB [Phenylobacterium sp.]MDO8378707.1 flagellar basal body rod protein FlgB [Phenylobacterium sp.]
MDIGDIPLFSMLRSRLGYLSERQKLIAQNVANSETPGFSPKDLKPYDFAAQMKLATSGAGLQAVTQPGHMTPPSQRAGGVARSFKAQTVKDSETTLDGNSVVLEEEMLKMSDARMSYDAAIGFYQKSLNLLRMAARAPGR